MPLISFSIWPKRTTVVDVGAYFTYLIAASLELRQLRIYMKTLEERSDQKVLIGEKKEHLPLLRTKFLQRLSLPDI